jgi:hypothetical protein
MKIPLPIKFVIALIALTGLIAATSLITGCSTVSAGSDPLVVRAQQTETIAFSAFDTFLKIDNANRSFIASNAPAVHAFAEQLRQPVMDGTNQTRLGLLWITQLDRVTQAYENNGASSNAVESAISVVETAVIAAEQDISLYGQTNSP